MTVDAVTTSSKRVAVADPRATFTHGPPFTLRCRLYEQMSVEPGMPDHDTCTGTGAFRAFEVRTEFTSAAAVGPDVTVGGVPLGVTGFEGAEAGPVPTPFVAVTVKV
jgi:hypothetical protein